MSWKFAGIIFKKNYEGFYSELLKILEITYYQTSGGFRFMDAISRNNQACALGVVNGNTVLLDHIIPYDCSYTPEKDGRLDKILRTLSLDQDILNLIVDGTSGTYCFSLFSNEERIRRWAVEPGNVLCNEGTPLNSEMSNEDEEHIFSIFKDFLGVAFQELIQNDMQIFHYFYH